MTTIVDISLNFDVDSLLQQFIYNIDTETATQNSLNDNNRYIDTITQEGMEQLEKIHYKNYLFITQPMCCISMENFKENEKIIKLPCDHIFKPKYIIKWVKQNPTCPICRFKLYSEVKIKNFDNEFNHPYFLDNSNNYISEMQEHEIQYEVDLLHQTLLNLFNTH